MCKLDEGVSTGVRYKAGYHVPDLLFLFDPRNIFQIIYNSFQSDKLILVIMNKTNKFNVPTCILLKIIPKFERIAYFAVLLLLMIAGFTSCTKEEDKPAGIHGVILDRVTGTPVRNAQVTATEWRFFDLMGFSSPRTAGMVYSNAIGQFSFDFIPASRYEYSISEPPA